MNSKREELVTLGLAAYCPSRIEKVGRPPTITASGSQSTKEERFAPWRPAVQQPQSDMTKKSMIREALRIVLKVVLLNHTYIFNNQPKKQTEGGPIGMDLSGLVAKIFMAWWDRQLLEKLANLDISIRLYKRYVDDINLAAKGLQLGTRLVEGSLRIVDEYIESDSDIPDDQRTLAIVKQVGETIHKSIKLKVDCPSLHADGKLPILDLKVWIHKGGDGLHTILHEHYIKDCASHQVTHANSALAWKDKRSILTQMCLKVLLNCSPQLPKDTVAGHLTYFSQRMQASGYEKKFRYEVIKSALDAYNNIKKTDIEGRKPMYRKKDYLREERRREKEERKRSWFKKGNYEAVMFVPATPESKLAKLYKKTIAKHKTKIRVVEKAGTKVKDLLQRNDPLSDKQCNDNKCFVCSTHKDDLKGNCRTSGITYSITCDNDQCSFRYIGQSSKNAYTRGREHQDDYNQKKNSSAMWNHCVEKHGGVQQPLTMTITDTCRNDCMKRQILEATRIRHSDPDHSMNSRTEWNFLQLPRLAIRT